MECDLTELDESVCGCPRHRGKSIAEDRRDADAAPILSTITAAFRGSCPRCGSRISVGDVIHKLDDEEGWVCEVHGR